jgi:hypothetical protein
MMQMVDREWDEKGVLGLDEFQMNFKLNPGRVWGTVKVMRGRSIMEPCRVFMQSDAMASPIYDVNREISSDEQQY